jgi:hypothetical protein
VARYSFGPGAIQSDLSQKLATMVERRYGALTLYAASAWLAEHFVAWTTIVHTRLQLHLFGWVRPNANEENLAKTVQVYIRNVDAEEALCQLHHIRYFFVLQPLVVTKHPLMKSEREAFAEIGDEGVAFVRSFYARASAAMVEREGFINAARILDGRTVEDFYDLGHTGALTSPVIGNALGRILVDHTHEIVPTSAGLKMIQE